MRLTDQPSLPLSAEPSFVAVDFRAAPSNAAATAWLNRTADWPDRRLLLWGEPGCGKTHLLNIWATRTGADYACRSRIARPARTAARTRHRDRRSRCGGRRNRAVPPAERRGRSRSARSCSRPGHRHRAGPCNCPTSPVGCAPSPRLRSVRRKMLCCMPCWLGCWTPGGCVSRPSCWIGCCFACPAVRRRCAMPSSAWMKHRWISIAPSPRHSPAMCSPISSARKNRPPSAASPSRYDPTVL